MFFRGTGGSKHRASNSRLWRGGERSPWQDGSRRRDAVSCLGSERADLRHRPVLEFPREIAGHHSELESLEVTLICCRASSQPIILQEVLFPTCLQRLQGLGETIEGTEPALAPSCE